MTNIYLKFLSISHRHISFFNALSEEKFDTAIEKLQLKKNQSVVDFGGGNGEFIIRLIERYRVKGIVVEQPDSSGNEVLVRAKKRIPLKLIDVNLKGTQGFLEQNKGQLFDLTACINSAALGKNYRSIIEKLKETASPKGLIVYGTPYWKTPPSQQFLTYLKVNVGISKRDFGTYAKIVEEGEKQGLIPIWACSASPDDLDNYIWEQSYAVENYVANRKVTDELSELLLYSRGTRNNLLNWYREYLGFGLFIFRKNE